MGNPEGAKPMHVSPPQEGNISPELLAQKQTEIAQVLKNDHNLLGTLQNSLEDDGSVNKPEFRKIVLGVVNKIDQNIDLANQALQAKIDQVLAEIDLRKGISNVRKKITQAAGLILLGTGLAISPAYAGNANPGNARIERIQQPGVNLKDYVRGGKDLVISNSGLKGVSREDFQAALNELQREGGFIKLYPGGVTFTKYSGKSDYDAIKYDFHFEKELVFKIMYWAARHWPNGKLGYWNKKIKVGLDEIDWKTGKWKEEKQPDTPTSPDKNQTEEQKIRATLEKFQQVLTEKSNFPRIRDALDLKDLKYVLQIRIKHIIRSGNLPIEELVKLHRITEGFSKDKVAKDLDLNIVHQTIAKFIEDVLEEKSLETPKSEFKFVIQSNGNMTESDLRASGENLKEIVEKQKKYVTAVENRLSEKDFASVEKRIKILDRMVGMLTETQELSQKDKQRLKKSLEKILNNTNGYRLEVEQIVNKLMFQLNTLCNNTFFIAEK